MLSWIASLAKQLCGCFWLISFSRVLCAFPEFVCVVRQEPCCGGLNSAPKVWFSRLL